MKMMKRINFIILFITFLITEVIGQNYDWKQYTINFVKVDSITYFFPSHVSEEYSIEAIADCKKIISENLSFINETEFTKAIDITFLNSREEMLRYTGYKSQGIAYPFRNAVFILINQRRQLVVKHEMMHMISVEKWGIPSDSSIWIYEGLATLVAGYCSDFSLEEIYQYYIQTDKLIPFDSLATNFRDYWDILSYYEATYIVKYLIDNYGLNKLKELWIGGIGKFYDIYGLTVSEFDEKLKNELRAKYKNNIEINWEEFKKGCE